MWSVQPDPLRRTASAALLRRIPAAVWAITALWFALLLGASIIWPVGTSYDEKAHLSYARTLAGDFFDLAAPPTLPYDEATVVVRGNLPLDPAADRLVYRYIDPRGERPTMGELAATFEFDPEGIENQMSQHPPLYYWVEAAMLNIPGVDKVPWDGSIWLMRLVSIILVMPVPILAWATARELLMVPGHRGRPRNSHRVGQLALAAAAVPLLLPNLIRVMSSVTNDALLLAAGAWLSFGLLRLARGNFDRRTIWIVAVSTVVGLWTKGFALTFVPLVALALILGVRAARREEATGLKWKQLLPIAGGLVVGLTWWVRNLFVFGALQPSGLSEATLLDLRGPERPGGEPTMFMFGYLREFIDRTWGGVGIPDTPYFGPLSYMLFGVCFLVCLGAVLSRSGPDVRILVAMMLAVPALASLLAMWGSWQSYARWDGLISAAQGRYLYHGVVAFAAVLVVGLGRLLRSRAHRPCTIAILASAALLNFSVWGMILRSWYAADQVPDLLGDTLDGFRSFLRWSPFSSVVSVVLVLLLPGVTALVALVLTVRATRPELDAPAGEVAGAQDLTFDARISAE